MKKLLSLMLSVVLVMSLLAGCGSDKEEKKPASAKDSSYFQELGELGEISDKVTTESLEFVINIMGDEATSEFPSQFMDGDTLKFNVKMDVCGDKDAKKGAVKVSAKIGAEDYKEVTTISYADNKLYLTVKPIIEFADSIDPGTGAQVEESIAQLGITDAISVDIDQLQEAISSLGIEMPAIDESVSEQYEAEAKEYLTTVSDILKKDFEALQGVDGSDYTLSINADTAEAAYDGVIKLFSEDLKTLMTTSTDYMKSVLGDSYDPYEMYGMTEDDFMAQLDAVAGEIETELPKDEFVSAIKDNNLNIVSKVRVDDEDGTFMISTGDITSDDVTFNMTMNMAFSCDSVDVDPNIPSDAVDMTSMLSLLLSQYGQVLGGNTDTIY